MHMGRVHTHVRVHACARACMLRSMAVYTYVVWEVRICAYVHVHAAGSGLTSRWSDS